MVRVRGSLIVLQVAAHAGRTRQVVVVVDVAIRALPRRHSVHPCQRKVRRVVVERGIRPRCCVVALGASLGKVGRDVVRIRSSLIVLQVTADTGSAGEVEVVVNVAVAALPRWNSVSTGQRETDRTVIEVRTEPGVRAMAQRAVGRESAGGVVRVTGRFEVGDVTRVALRRQCLKLAAGCSLVTGVAIQGGMSPGQRKAVVVLLHLLHRDLPSTNGVAPFAVRSQLPLVNIGVAVLATLSNI